MKKFFNWLIKVCVFGIHTAMIGLGFYVILWGVKFRETAAMSFGIMLILGGMYSVGTQIHDKTKGFIDGTAD